MAERRPSPHPRPREVALVRDPLARPAARLGLGSGQLWTVAVTALGAGALLVAVFVQTLQGAP